MAGEAREKCAVAAFVADDTEANVVGLTYEALFAMQHRGTDASGIAAGFPDMDPMIHRGKGMVKDVFAQEGARKLAGSITTGQNRYTTDEPEVSARDHTQPFNDSPIGLFLSHNGNLPVTEKLDGYLEKHGIKPAVFNDSERVGLAVGQEIRNGYALPDAVERIYPLLRGSFSITAMHDGMVVGFRDEKGIRPLALGAFQGGRAIVSETCGLDIVNAGYEREVRPGEMVIVTPGHVESRQLAEGDEKLDMFEIVYFARHDSFLYDRSVNEMRYEMGRRLAEEHPLLREDNSNTLVVPIPDTSVPAAEGYAQSLGLRHRMAVVKNRYIGRTFMDPAQPGSDSQVVRNNSLRRKHNMIPDAIRGRDVIFIDDSIVRLNTMPRLVALAKMCGARTVSVLVASPPVRFPDFYGIDTPKQSELAAANMRSSEIQRKIDCEYLGYLSLGGMIKATGLPETKFNLSCFTGEYPIGIGRRKEEISAPIEMTYVS